MLKHKILTRLIFTKDILCAIMKEIITKEVATVNRKQTSQKVATKASDILRDGRTSNKSKSVAGSALSQTRTGKKK